MDMEAAKPTQAQMTKWLQTARNPNEDSRKRYDAAESLLESLHRHGTQCPCPEGETHEGLRDEAEKISSELSSETEPKLSPMQQSVCDAMDQLTKKLVDAGTTEEDPAMYLGYVDGALYGLDTTTFHVYEAHTTLPTPEGSVATWLRYEKPLYTLPRAIQIRLGGNVPHELLKEPAEEPMVDDEAAEAKAPESHFVRLEGGPYHGAILRVPGDWSTFVVTMDGPELEVHRAVPDEGAPAVAGETYDVVEMDDAQNGTAKYVGAWTPPA